jgi:putative transposase
MKFDLGRVEIRKRGRRTHWVAEHAIYSLTFNLHDAVPEPLRRRIELEGEAQLERIRRINGSVSRADAQSVKELTRAKIERALDHGYGEALLRDPQIADMVASTISHFDEDRYTLLSWCVMPTHVHVVAHLRTPVDRLIHSWKTFTGRTANELLDRDGPFWQAGYYDTCIRDSNHLYNTIEYVANNPAAAGLGNWPFVRVYSERLSA